VPEAERRQGTRNPGVLVEARGHADRVRERLAEGLDPQAGVVDDVAVAEPALDRGVVGQAERHVAQPVGGLGREREQQRPDRVVASHRAKGVGRPR